MARNRLIAVAIIAALGGGLLTRVLVVRIGPGYLPTVESVDRELAKNPALAAIRVADPDSYVEVRQIALDGAIHHQPKPELQAAIRAVITTSLRKFLPHASASAVLKLTRVTTLEIDEFGAKSADACVDFLFPGPGRKPVSIAEFVSPEVMQQDAAVEQAVFESASDPQPVPTKSAVASTLNGVVQRLAGTFGADTVASLGHPATMAPAALCAVTGALYKDILALPPSESVPLLRFLFAQNTAA